MAVATDVGLGFGGVVVAVDVEEFEPVPGLGGKGVVERASLGRRIGHRQKE